MRAVPAKHVAVRAGDRMEPMATFHMEGDRVVAAWHNANYRRDVEETGVRAVVDGELARLRPRDGRAFYEALDLAYWQSSMVVVTDTLVTVDDTPIPE